MTENNKNYSLSVDEMKELYRQMVLIRIFEERAAEMYTKGRIGGFMHLYIGQEAVAVGAISAIRPEDYVFTHYREHGHILAKGSDPKKVMAELFGKETGVSKGKGGSMHLFDRQINFMGGYAIVAGMLPLAVGAGLAINYKGEDKVSLCFFGDGAADEGAFHESLNLAALWKLPVIFILENNLYSMGMSVYKASSNPDFYKRSLAYGIASEVVDGQDVLAVREAVSKAVSNARSGHGPYFIETRTYRFRGHSMADPVYYRSKEEEEEWKARDPIKIFEKKLTEEGLFSLEQLKEIENNIIQIIQEAIDFAESSPEPAAYELYSDTCVDSFCPAFVRGG